MMIAKLLLRIVSKDMHITESQRRLKVLRTSRYTGRTLDLFSQKSKYFQVMGDL